MCVYHQPTATSSQDFNLSLMSTEVTHAAVSRLICISKAENAILVLVIRLNSVLYQGEQRSDEDWLDWCAASAREFLYTSFNREM